MKIFKCCVQLYYILVYFNYPIMLCLKYLYVTPRWSGSKFGWSLELHKALRVPALYTECTIHKYPTRRKLNVPCSYHQYPKKCWRFHFHPIRMSWQLLIFHLFLLSEIWPERGKVQTKHDLPSQTSPWLLWSQHEGLWEWFYVSSVWSRIV